MFLIAPTVILFIQIMVTTWRYTWLVTLIMEMVYVVIFWYVGKALFQHTRNPHVEQLLVEETVGQQGTEAVLNRRSTTLGPHRAGRAVTWPVEGDERDEVEGEDVSSGGAGETKKEADSNDARSPVLEIDLDWD